MGMKHDFPRSTLFPFYEFVMVLLKDRQYWIDAVRSFACICVLMTHSPIPSTVEGRIFIPAYNFCAVGGASILFFMISGALVLYKRQEFFSFIKKRISRIVLPMVIWTIVSLIVACLEGKLEWNEMLDKIWMIPFAPQVSTYWFIYVIFGIYLLTPIISTWLANTGRREVEVMLLFWACTLLFPFIQSENILRMKSFDGGCFYYFYGYLGFAVLGYYLRKYVNFERCTWRLAVTPFIIIACTMAIYPTNLISHAVLQDRLALPAVLLAFCYFLFLKHIPISNVLKKCVYQFAQHSFGIYLVHILVMRSVLWPIFEPLHINHAIAIPLITFLTALLSFIIVWGIGKVVPFSKYIVGV